MWEPFNRRRENIRMLAHPGRNPPKPPGRGKKKKRTLKRPCSEGKNLFERQRFLQGAGYRGAGLE